MKKKLPDVDVESLKSAGFALMPAVVAVIVLVAVAEIVTLIYKW
jgi:hypothetical protein